METVKLSENLRQKIIYLPNLGCDIHKDGVPKTRVAPRSLLPKGFSNAKSWCFRFKLSKKRQIPLPLLCYDLPFLCKGLTGDLYTRL